MFKTPEGRDRYFAAYDAMLARWPAQAEALDVPTRFGPTHINACGPKSAPPLLLLPGAAFSSTMWYPNVSAWQERLRVYALDIIGDMGKSVLTVQKLSHSDYEAWLSDVLDGLGHADAHVAALSLGGYLALRLAAFAPDRVRKLVLMSPAGVVPFRKRFFLNLFALALPVGMPVKLKWLVGADSPHTLALFRLATTKTDFRYAMILPKSISDEALAAVAAPTLVLMGEADAVYGPDAIFARFQGRIRDLRCERVPGGGHALSLDRPEIVNRLVLDFLGEEQGEPP